MKWKKIFQDTKRKIGIFFLEVRFHKRVLSYLTFKEKIRYSNRQIINRACERHEDCFGEAHLQRMSTNHPDELSNYAFYCVRCRREAEQFLEKWSIAHIEEVGVTESEESNGENHEVDGTAQKSLRRTEKKKER